MCVAEYCGVKGDISMAVKEKKICIIKAEAVQNTVSWHPAVLFTLRLGSERHALSLCLPDTRLPTGAILTITHYNGPFLALTQVIANPNVYYYYYLSHLHSLLIPLSLLLCSLGTQRAWRMTNKRISFKRAGFRMAYNCIVHWCLYSHLLIDFLHDILNVVIASAGLSLYWWVYVECITHMIIEDTQTWTILNLLFFNKANALS